MEWFARALVEHPEIAVFLALGIGFLVGRLSWRGIALGTVTGTLLVGVVIGAIVSVPGPDGTTETIVVADVTKQIFFLLFLFSLGYRVGPQFFAGLRGSGVPQAIFAFAMIIIGIGTAVIVSLVLGYNPGLAAGLTAGALTQSSIIGVAQESISGLNVPADQVAQWNALVPVAYAVTYIFGTLGAAIYCGNIAYRLLGIKDLPAAAKEDEERLGFAEEQPDTIPAADRVRRRVYLVPAGLQDQPASTLEANLTGQAGARVHVDRIRRDGAVTEVIEDPTVRAGDVVVLATPDVRVFQVVETMGFTESDDEDLLHFPIEQLDIVVTNKDIVGRTIGSFRERNRGRGLFLTAIHRSGQELPIADDIAVAAGDEMRIQGPKPLVEQVIPRIGYPERATPATDMTTIAIGIVIGALIGLPTITVGNVPLGLTESVGALLVGLFLGWQRSKSPTFGRVPSGAQWFFENVGLAAFVGIVGINAGPGFVDGLREYGLGLFFAGVIVTLVPLVAGTLLARYVFHFDPVLSLGMITGAQTTTAAVGAVKDAARSSVPLLGFTVPYAIGNIFLTVGGAIVVAIVAQ
jgi:putative transport protein